MINDTLKANSPYINVSYDECVMGSVGYYKCMARGSTQSLDKPTLSVIIQGLSNSYFLVSRPRLVFQVMLIIIYMHLTYTVTSNVNG
jgi:hypothetical protein